MQTQSHPEPSQPNSEPPKSEQSWLTRKRAFQIGSLLGGIGFACLLAAGGAAYLYITKDSISFRDGQVTFSKPTEVRTTEKNPSIQGNNNTSGIDGGVANSGPDAQVARDPDRSFNKTQSPSVTGDYNKITIITSRELPGFSNSESGYLSTAPSELNRYTKASDLQPDALMQQASETRYLKFEKSEIVVLGKIYTSFFSISRYAKESRFVFQLDRTQNAALLQFALPDPPSVGNPSGSYVVKISADGQVLWAGECQISQGRQIISVPLDIPDAQTLTIEVTGNGVNSGSLYFTEARVFKK